MNRLVFLLFLAVATFRSAPAEPVPAHYKQGSIHGFLLLKSTQGKVIGVGEIVQVARGTQLDSRTMVHFRDGSVDEESTELSEQDTLRLVSDHHVQKGPSFPTPIDLTIDVPGAKVTWQETKDGKIAVKTDHMQLPNDLANGMMPIVVTNLPLNGTETTVSYLATTPKPRLVKLRLKSEGRDGFTVGWLNYFATRYNIHVELGGLAGVIAPLIGKQPPDTSIWVITGEAPSFIKMQGPFYDGGPVWTIQLVSPAWPSSQGQ